jgi:hypothetical protein
LTVKRGINPSFVHPPSTERRYPLFRLCFYLAQSCLRTSAEQNYPTNVTNDSPVVVHLRASRRSAAQTLLFHKGDIAVWDGGGK